MSFSFLYTHLFLILSRFIFYLFLQMVHAPVWYSETIKKKKFKYGKTIVKSIDLWWWRRPFILGDFLFIIAVLHEQYCPSLYLVEVSNVHQKWHCTMARVHCPKCHMYTSLVIFTSWGRKTRGDFPLSGMAAQAITDAGFWVLRYFPEAARTDQDLLKEYDHFAD